MWTFLDRSKSLECDGIAVLVRAATYVIDGHEFVVVLEDHDLVFGVTNLGVLPVVNSYLNSFRAIVTWHMEDATSLGEFVATQTLLGDTGGVIEVGVRRGWADAEPRAACSRWPREGTDEEGHYW